MLILIYALLMTAHFVFAYTSYKSVTYYGSEDDALFFSIPTSIFFPLCMWFTIPWAIIKLEPWKKKR